METLARKRWDLLRRAILTKTLDTHSTDSLDSVSIRRFLSFDLFKVTPIISSDSLVKWLTYEYSGTAIPRVVVNVGLLPQNFELNDIGGFNNTGNVCIWPSEEVMAFYCLENISLFKGKNVCELGAGMTGLAGLMLAATNTTNEVVLTDGNEKSVSNLSSLVISNELRFVSTFVLRWNSDIKFNKQFRKRFEVVLCADCLFFTSVHDDLLQVMMQILTPNGTVFIFAPDRSGTFGLFFDKAEKYFHVQILDCYHKLITDKHVHLIESDRNYDPNIHYPKCAILKLR